MNVVHQEQRWTTSDGTECFKTVDEERAEVGKTYLDGGDGGMWFKVIRLRSRHWWHHLDPDPGFKVEYELEVGGNHFGLGFPTITVPIPDGKTFEALQGALDIIRDDKAAREASAPPKE